MRELEKSAKAILLNDWDPIGVKANPNAKAEYDQYALTVVGMANRGATEIQIASYLNEITEREFGLRPNIANARAAAAKVIEAFVKSRK